MTITLQPNGARSVMTGSRNLLFIALLATTASTLLAQGPPPVPRPQGKPGASVDLTGTWVSVITEDWRWRMVTPIKGDAASVPINRKARAIVDAWDPAKDEAAGEQCKAYGAPTVLRNPTRLRITWQDDLTLKMEADNGTQTRLLHFGAPAPSGQAPSWQGYSAARWEPSSNAGSDGGLGFVLGGQRAIPRSRTLEVTTTNLREGYLRKNGVPYSAKAAVTEYFDRFSEPNGDEWFTVLTVVNDPEYLATPYVISSDFKRESDASKFNPTPCTAR
jgi:hypothetical protein